MQRTRWIVIWKMQKKVVETCTTRVFAMALKNRNKEKETKMTWLKPASQVG